MTTIDTGQTSVYQPAVVFDGPQPSGSGTNYHMLFKSEDSSTNRLLYATSPDGMHWTLAPDRLQPHQFTSRAPAIALCQVPALPNPAVTPDARPSLLVAVFVSNDDQNRILCSTLDLDTWSVDQPSLSSTWQFMGQLEKESARAVYALGIPGVLDPKTGHPQQDPVGWVFFLAEHDDRLLAHQFDPLKPPPWT